MSGTVRITNPPTVVATFTAQVTAIGGPWVAVHAPGVETALPLDHPAVRWSVAPTVGAQVEVSVLGMIVVDDRHRLALLWDPATGDTIVFAASAVERER